MTKKPITTVLTMGVTLAVLLHAAVLLAQQETAWWLVMDAACGLISLGMCVLSLICRKRGGTKTAWKIAIGLFDVQMLAAIVLQAVPIERNRYQLLFWGFMSVNQCALTNDMRKEPPAYVPQSISDGTVIFYKVIIGMAIAMMIFSIGVLICYLICYDEAIFYKVMGLMGINVMLMNQAILPLQQNEAAEDQKRKENAENSAQE